MCSTTNRSDRCSGQATTKRRVRNYLRKDIVCSHMKVCAGVLAHRLVVATLVDIKRRITFITPHQLSTDAKQLVRDGSTNFVRQIAEKGYYSGSKQLDQEVDGEMYIHIEKKDKDAFLTVQRGKHRNPNTISDEAKYFVLKFPKSGPIKDDILREDSSLRRVGGTPNEETEDELFNASTSKPLVL